MNKDLKIFNSITKELQSDKLTMSEANALFGTVISDYPVFARYLAPNAQIVHSTRFEMAVTKIQNDRESELSNLEKAFVSMLHIPDVVISSKMTENLSYAAKSLFEHKSKKQKTTCHVDTTYILRTSNICERLISQCRWILTVINDTLWDAQTVSEALKNNK